MTRVWILLGKELADLRQNRAVFVPAIITGAVSVVLPFLVAVVVPALSGERLADSGDFQVAVQMYRAHPALGHLSPEAAIQGWIFQRFLVLLVLTPVAGAMSVAAYSVVGEKQARTLEPLLTTPLTTVELLAAKVLGALLPALALTLACFAAYVAGVAVAAQPGAFRALLTPASLAVTFLLGPLAALTALQLAVCVSSRVSDPRSAQQIGALVVLPVAGLLVLQLTGSFEFTARATMLLALALLAVNAGLMRLGVTLFDRESILVRWK